MYNFNVENHIHQNVPKKLNSPVIISILKVITWPLRLIIYSLNMFVSDTNNKLSYNSQLCSMEGLLNDRYDTINRDISITDAASISMLVAYPADDASNRIIISTSANFNNHPVIAFQNEIIGYNLDKFNVNIPDSNEIRLRENELKATVKLYKLAGKGFILRYY